MSEIFVDKNHVVKNMVQAVGWQKATALSLYEKALKAPSTDEFVRIKEKYGPLTDAYLRRFPDAKFYKAT